MKYSKPSLSYPEQLHLLEKRGLVCDDPERVKKYLQQIGYYRLSAYMLPFYQTADQHYFKKGTLFDDILDLYIFDRKLRILLFDAIEKIEVSFRAMVTDVFVNMSGTHSYADKINFGSKYNHDRLISKIKKEVNKRCSETFMVHYANKYSDPELPPFWMASQTLSFGEIGILYSNIRNSEVKNRVAQSYGLSDVVLASWMRSLSDLRNFCAHHSRIWNREFGAKAVIPNKPIKGWITKITPIDTEEITIDPHNRLFYQIAIIWYFLKHLDLGMDWLNRFRSLCSEYDINMEKMGFESSWLHSSFWHDSK